MTKQEKIEWVKNYLGASFVKGVSVGNYIATVIVATEDGEKEVVISLPNKEIANYSKGIK